MQSIHKNLHNLGGARNYCLVAKLLELARDRAKDAPCLGLFFIFAASLEYHDRVFVKADVAAVLAAKRLALAHDDGVQDVLLFNCLARLGRLDRKDNYFPYLGIALARAAGYLENASNFGAGVVCNNNECAVLDHRAKLKPLRALGTRIHGF